MDLPPISETCVWQEYARLPSICTMHAPHRPVPQPNLVPVSFKPSRITHNNGVAGGASVDAALPFTVKLVAVVSARGFRGIFAPRYSQATRQDNDHASRAFARAGWNGRARPRLPVAWAKALA